MSINQVLHNICTTTAVYRNSSIKRTFPPFSIALVSVAFGHSLVVIINARKRVGFALRPFVAAIVTPLTWVGQFVMLSLSLSLSNTHSATYNIARVSVHNHTFRYQYAYYYRIFTHVEVVICESESLTGNGKPSICRLFPGDFLSVVTWLLFSLSLVCSTTILPKKLQPLLSD